MSQFFFDSSPAFIEWDKTVAEIINTTFVFLGHPTVSCLLITVLFENGPKSKCEEKKLVGWSVFEVKQQLVC